MKVCKVPSTWPAYHKPHSRDEGPMHDSFARARNHTVITDLQGNPIPLDELSTDMLKQLRDEGRIDMITREELE